MKKKFYIDYPQEKKDPTVNNYRCKLCKEESLKINGLLEKHKDNCDYRIEQEKLLDELI
ncbi:MAG: hypothetical protein P8K73_01040 [Methylophilaceae bacterium]|jgi:hypothetical protein|nr:hypothetical protein [Methylophilaceae bacterium]